MMRASEIRMDLLIPSRNLRSGGSDIEELTASVAEHGILQPIRVRPIGDGRFQIIAGHRRFSAARALGLAAVPAVIVEEDDRSVAVQTIVENLQREDLTPLDLAKGIRELEASFGMDHGQIAKAISKSPAEVRTYLRLARLPDDVLADLESGEGRTQLVKGMTIRTVRPLMSSVPIAPVGDAAAQVRIEEASTTIRQLKNELVRRDARINAHMADEIGRHMREGKMTVSEALDDVLSRPDDFRYSRAPISPEELEQDTWSAYKNIQRDVGTLIYRLRPEIASAFSPSQRNDLLEQLIPFVQRLDDYRRALVPDVAPAVEQRLISGRAE